MTRSLWILKVFRCHKNALLTNDGMNIMVFYVSSNIPKNVQPTNEMIPNIKDRIAKINFPKKRITIAVVIRTKHVIK